MDSPCGIRAVTLDVGGTLIEPWPSVGHVYAAVATEHGHAGLSSETLNRQFARAWRRKRDFDHSRTAWRAMVQDTFAGFLDRETAATLLEPLYRRFAQAAAWRLFDDVMPVLDSLRSQGIRLAVVSNWDERLRPLLQDLRLTPFFEAIVISIETGHAKPSEEIFRRCLELLRLPAGAILHVGDSAEEDVQGARKAGLRALLLQRKGRPHSDESIRSLAEVQPWLADAVTRGWID